METTLAVIALVVSLLGIGYTHQQTKQAKRANQLTEQAQREQVQPYVIADIRERVSGSQLLCFFIENTGPTMARDVQLAVNPPLQSTLGAKAADRLNEAVTSENTWPPLRYSARRVN